MFIIVINRRISGLYSAQLYPQNSCDRSHSESGFHTTLYAWRNVVCWIGSFVSRTHPLDIYNPICHLHVLFVHACVIHFYWHESILFCTFVKYKMIIIITTKLASIPAPLTRGTGNHCLRVGRFNSKFVSVINLLCYGHPRGWLVSREKIAITTLAL